MNKKFLKHYMETESEGTSKKYFFLVDNQDIAMNIVMSGYQALYLGQEDDGYYFSVNSFIEDMRSIRFHGTCQSVYHYVAACTTKWVNNRILEFCIEEKWQEESVQQLLPDAEEELRLSVAGTLPILRRCHSELFFECGMKMTLAGKAQEFTDRTDGLICVLQKFSSFFQFTAQDKCTD